MRSLARPSVAVPMQAGRTLPVEMQTRSETDRGVAAGVLRIARLPVRWIVVKLNRGGIAVESIVPEAGSGIICLMGVGHGGAIPKIPTADLASSAVLKNYFVFGSVNANKRHWYKAGEALARTDHHWLARLIARVEKPENFKQALERKSEDIKAVIQFSEI